MCLKTSNFKNIMHENNVFKPKEHRFYETLETYGIVSCKRGEIASYIIILMHRINWYMYNV